MASAVNKAKKEDDKTDKKDKNDKKDKLEKVLFALDIEGSGASFSQNGIVAIGWCVGKMDGKILEKKRVSVALQKRGFEPRCKTQYWDNPAQAAQLEVFKKEALEPVEAMKQFIASVDRFEDSYDVIILTDNAAYDVAWLNYYLDLYLGRNPLSYKKDQMTYRPIAEPKGFAMSRKMKFNSNENWSFDMEKYKDGLTKLKIMSLHDHWPENDAENIYRKTLLLCEC
jgi:hypothetical protein